MKVRFGTQKVMKWSFDEVQFCVHMCDTFRFLWWSLKTPKILYCNITGKKYSRISQKKLIVSNISEQSQSSRLPADGTVSFVLLASSMLHRLNEGESVIGKKKKKFPHERFRQCYLGKDVTFLRSGIGSQPTFRNFQKQQQEQFWVCVELSQQTGSCFDTPLIWQISCTLSFDFS